MINNLGLVILLQEFFYPPTITIQNNIYFQVFNININIQVFVQCGPIELE